jgi:hypothetical protein
MEATSSTVVDHSLSTEIHPLQVHQEPGPPAPQTQIRHCEAAPLRFNGVDRIPLLAMSDDEMRILKRHAEDLSAQLLGPDGIVALRQLLAKRLALLDIESQRLAAVQEFVLHSNLKNEVNVNRLMNSAHRRFLATAELCHRR